MAVARSSSGGVALRYVLPVLWMTLHLAVMGATKGLEAFSVVDQLRARPGRSLMSMNARLVLSQSTRVTDGQTDRDRTPKTALA